MPAPKGNKFALENSGRPKKWATPEDLKFKVDNYFEEMEHLQEPFTVEDLALWLECEIMTLLNYEKKKGYEEYFDIIKNAKQKIYSSWIKNGLTGKYNARFVEFVLSNNTRYSHKQEITHQAKNLTFITVLSKDEDKELIDIEEE